MSFNRCKYRMSGLFTVLLLLAPILTLGQDRQLTFEDIMKWEDISQTSISANGDWLIYSVWPDRGDGEVRVRSVDNDRVYTINLGDKPRITKNGQWVGAFVKPSLADELKAEKDKKPKRGMALLNTGNGNTVQKDSVKAFGFSNDGKWVAIHHYLSGEMEKKHSKNKNLGSEVVLRNLATGREAVIPFVSEMAFDSTSRYLAYSVVDTAGSHNGLYIRNLNEENLSEQVIHQQEDGYYANLAWKGEHPRLAFTEAKMDTAFEAGDANIHVWSSADGLLKEAVMAEDAGSKWALRSHNDLKWTKDGERLFFGVMDREMVEIGQNKKETKTIEIYNREDILDEAEVDVWHWDDPRIKTHEKETWKERKNHLYRAVYHLDSGEWVQLADKQVPDVEVSHNPKFALGSSDIPYLKLITWEWFYDDYYTVDLKTGEKKLVAEKLSYGADLSPGGNYVVFYEDRQWHLYDIQSGVYSNLTENLSVPFYNEDHDYPIQASGYGLGGWIEGDEAVLIYDKYDIWKFPTDGGKAVNISRDGRDRQIRYRIERLDPDKLRLGSKEELLLRGYYDRKKTYGFYTVKVNRQGTSRRLEEDKKFDFIAAAEDSDRIIYSRESYDEYPNLWVSEGKRFKKVRRLSELHTDLHETYNWGTAELIEWKSLDGESIQGAVIKPDTYEEGKKYPVLIYYYRFFSQRAYEFNNITNDDRPTLPQWVSDNYVVFLPDIRFEVGTPGFASTKSLVPGVQKLIDMGIADPDKLGLHGHSWSGYQTAFMITQTDIFDAAIAGAPVSNMTSAYSGIRWGSGLARQFQYEQSQSRIGGSLWEYPENYIENSPVFYADRINTPLLIMFGDEDTAVPWYQGIELYLAMRRLGKDAVFLQYRKEPHHLQEYGNRLDYAIKMKEYFDHYLRGAEAPGWIREGVPYRGK